MITKNFAYTFLIRCIILLSGFLVSIFTAHYLGPNGRGDYFFVTTLALLLVQLGSLGMQSSNVYLVAKNEQILGYLVTNAAWVSIIIGSLAAISAWITLNYRHQHISGIQFLAILAPASLFYLLGTNLLIGINKIKLFNLFQISSNLTVGLLLLASGFLGFTIEGFLAITSFTWLSIDLLLIYVFSHYTTLPFKFNFNFFHEGFGFGIKTYASTILGTAVLKGNIFLLKVFTSTAILGYYSIASQISDALIIIPSTCALLLFPDLVKNPYGRLKKTQRALLSITFFMTIVYAAVALTAKWFIPGIFGVRFAPAVPILLFMLPGSFCLGIISIISQYVVSHNFPKTIVYFWLIGFFLMTGFGFIFIPKFSGEGAAMGLSSTYILICIMILIFSYRFQRKQLHSKKSIQILKKNLYESSSL